MKIRRVSGGPGREHALARSRPDRARDAAIEKQLSAYIEMGCGHWTTHEAQEFARHWRPKGKTWWCEECGRWVQRKLRYKPPPLPDVPPF